MDLGQFLSCLRESGHAKVVRDEAVPAGEVAAVLRRVDADVRLDAPSGLPDLDLPAAIWGAERLYSACALFLYRDLGSDAVLRRLGVVCPSPVARPATHYAVDLSLRHLRELAQLARGVAPDDPLLVALRSLATAWPLSSVGMPDVGAVDPGPLCANAGLFRLYVDRILEQGDQARATDPRVATAIAAAVGEHRELADSFLGAPRRRPA